MMTALLKKVPKVITSPIRIRHTKTVDEDVIISVSEKEAESEKKDAMIAEPNAGEDGIAAEAEGGENVKVFQT